MANMRDSMRGKFSKPENPDKNSIWTWILKSLYLIVDTNAPNYSDSKKDDIVQEVALKLINQSIDNDDFIKEIYDTENLGKLRAIMRTIILNHEGKSFFDTRMDYYRYKPIHDICNQYGITESPENAWKIWGIMNDKEFSISTIEQILIRKKPKVLSYESYIEQKDYTDEI